MHCSIAVYSHLMSCEMEEVESLSHLTSNSQLRALTQLLGKLNLKVTMNLTWKPENWTGGRECARVTQEQVAASFAFNRFELDLIFFKSGTTLILRSCWTVRRRERRRRASTDTLEPSPKLISSVNPSLIIAISCWCLLQSSSTSKGSRPESLRFEGSKFGLKGQTQMNCSGFLHFD